MSRMDHVSVDPALRDALAHGLAATELWSLLLWVLEQRAAQRTPAIVRQQWESDRFVQPCAVSQRILNELDSHLLAAAAEFEAVELSPLAPLASCSSVALTTQNRVVSTARGTEVISDPTNVLALECAKRLREAPGAVIKLTTSHRCVRAQAVPKRPGFAAHFRMFCLASAAHERKDHGFVTDAMIEHIRTHIAALDRLEQHGYRFPDRTLRLLSTPERAHVAKRIAAAIPEIAATLVPLEHSYYDGLRFMLDAGTPAGNAIPLVDGGAFDWVRKLTDNQRMVYVASGMGSQLAAMLFRRVAQIA
jgi:hypothetical protein